MPCYVLHSISIPSCPLICSMVLLYDWNSGQISNGNLQIPENSPHPWILSKREAVIFFIYSSGFYVGFYFRFIYFYYIYNNNEEACDTAVTWHVTWCDVIKA